MGVFVKLQNIRTDFADVEISQPGRSGLTKGGFHQYLFFYQAHIFYLPKLYILSIPFYSFTSILLFFDLLRIKALGKGNQG